MLCPRPKIERYASALHADHAVAVVAADGLHIVGEQMVEWSRWSVLRVNREGTLGFCATIVICPILGSPKTARCVMYALPPS